MATTKRDKRVAEIKALCDKLPDNNFVINLKFISSEINTNVYSEALLVMSKLLTGLEFDGVATSVPSKYAFVAFATDKQIAKKSKISISSIIHTNYKK